MGEFGQSGVDNDAVEPMSLGNPREDWVGIGECDEGCGMWL